MAVMAGIFAPAGNDATGTVANGASSAEITINAYQLFAFTASDDISIKFGNAGMAAADATSFRIPGGTVAIYQVPKQFTRFRLFNGTAATITWWIQNLSATI